MWLIVTDWQQKNVSMNPWQEFFFPTLQGLQALTVLRVKRQLSGLSVECIVLVRQTEKMRGSRVWEKPRQPVRPLLFDSRWIHQTPIPPYRPHERPGLLVGPPGPIWGPLIGSRALWERAQRNHQHLLCSAPLYTKLIVIPSSMSKMGLLGAIGFSLALVSLTQVSVVL